MVPPAPRTSIRRLPPEVVERIAAGEVVERPASVVKELVENSIDAGATQIRIDLAEGGIARIEVADDGGGIPEGELPLAVERHATSKLPETGDLVGVATLGFRGEALASIGSVSRLKIVSRAPGVDHASGISVIGGQVGPVFSAARAPGTTVSVEELFFNTPARRKFLKGAAAEAVAVTRVVEPLYLAHPEVGFTLGHREGAVLRLPASRRLLDAAARVLGNELLTDSIAVDASIADGVRVEGVLGRPSLTRASSANLHLIVDGRPVVAPPLVQAVRAAFREFLPPARFPVGVLRLTIDPARVDVNVHPTKREVRIARDRELADALVGAVRRALTASPRPARAPALPLTRSPRRPRDGEVEATREPPVSLAFAPGVERGPRQSTLFPAPGPVPIVSERRPSMELIGAVFDLYWLARSENSLVLIDQHAASERLVYELLMRSGRAARQELVVPARVELTAKQVAVLDSDGESVRAAGFEVEAFGAGRVRVTAVPTYRGRSVAVGALPELLDELAGGGRPTVPNGAKERRTATIACHSAVRGGDTITAEEMARILAELERVEPGAYACPHGRPILVEIDRARLDRMFLRPGESRR